MGEGVNTDEWKVNTREGGVNTSKRMSITPLLKKQQQKHISWPEWTEELSSCLSSFLCLLELWSAGSFSALWPSLCQQSLHLLSICLSTGTQNQNCTSDNSQLHSPCIRWWKCFSACSFRLVSSLWHSRPQHTTILHQLFHDFGIQGTAVNWSSSYFPNRTQSVSINSNTPESALVSFGVPQGSVLWPVLLVLYTAPLSSQPVFSIFRCSPLPSGTCQTPGLSIPWCCLPTSSSALSSSPFHCGLQDGFGQT